MFETYTRLLKQSFFNSFKKEEYKRWWAVPVGERLKFGLVVGLSFIPVYILLGIYNSPATFIAFLLGVIFIFTPLAEHFVEKLKKQYDK